VVPKLRERHHVTTYDLGPPGNDNTRHIEGDILNLSDLVRALHGAEVVVHLAASRPPPEESDDRIMEVNVMGTHRVLEACAKCAVRRVVFASCDSVYGWLHAESEILPLYFPVDEDHPFAVEDAYGLSKLFGEEICARYHSRYGISVVCLRFASIWTPDDYPRRSQWLQESKELYRTLFAYVDARDAAQAVDLAVRAPRKLEQHAFLVSAADTLADEPSLSLIGAHYPNTIELRHPAVFIEEPFASLHDHSQAAEALGYSPQYSWRLEGQRASQPE